MTFQAASLSPERVACLSIQIVPQSGVSRRARSVFRLLKPLLSLPKVMGRQPNHVSACRTWSLELDRAMLVSWVDSGPRHGTDPLKVGCVTAHGKGRPQIQLSNNPQQAV